jgi:hypothetical protein
MIPVWNGWHFTDGYKEPCRFCATPTKDVCLHPPRPLDARQYLLICSACRRALRKLKLLSTHGEWARGEIGAVAR